MHQQIPDFSIVWCSSGKNFSHRILCRCSLSICRLLFIWYADVRSSFKPSNMFDVRWDVAEFNEVVNISKCLKKSVAINHSIHKQLQTERVLDATNSMRLNWLQTKRKLLSSASWQQKLIPNYLWTSSCWRLCYFFFKLFFSDCFRSSLIRNRKLD